MSDVGNMKSHKRELREGDIAGRKTPHDIVFNDLDELSIRQNFFKQYKLASIKCWHIRGEVIQGLHLTYKNPMTGHLASAGPHVCDNLQEHLVSSATLEFDSDEYLEEVRGYSTDTVNYLLFRSSKGKYAEFGDSRSGPEFRFRSPKGNHIICISYGFTETCLKFLQITLAPLAFMPTVPVPVIPAPAFEGTPRIIQRTEYAGAEEKKGTVVDDFFSLNLHPYVREGSVQIVQISALHNRCLLGLEIVYLVGGEMKASSYNYNMQRHGNATKHCLELSEEYITEVACLVDDRYITCLSLLTSNGHHMMVGHAQRPEKLVPLTPKNCRVLAFRGMFDPDGLQALMMYYLSL